jgi:hypothetical protein
MKVFEMKNELPEDEFKVELSNLGNCFTGLHKDGVIARVIT